MVVILILLFLTFLLSFYFKKTFGKVLPISLMLIPLILYCSQFLFNTFKIGIYIIILLSIGGVGITIYKLIKKDKDFFKSIFSKGFFAFLLVLIFLYITDLENQFCAWDELAHWGVMVKEMLRLDKFYAIAEANMVWHKDYPPFLSLFEYFWAYILGYSEQTMQFSLHTYLFGMIVPFLVDKIKKNSLIFLFPIITLCSILMLDSYEIFKTVQTDFIISLEVIFPLLIIYFEKNDTLYKKLSISFSIIALILTKQIGLPLALMVFVYYILNEIFNDKTKLKNKKFWLSNFLIILLPIILFVIWSIYTTMLNTGAQFSMGNINIKEYLEIVFLNQGVEYKLQSIALFKKYLFTEPVLVKPISLGYIYCYFIAIIILTLIYKLNKNEFNFKKYILILIIFTCGTIGYALTMSVLYLFCFSESETITLACFGRYMSSYVLIEFLFLLCLTIYYWSKKEHFIIKTIILTIILSVSVNSGFKCLYPQEYFGDNYIEFKSIAKDINDNTEENAKIFVVMEDYSYSYLLQYFIGSRIVCQEFNYLYKEIDNYEKDRVIEVLFTQDYIFLNDIPNGFKEKYGSLFKSPILPKTLYKINNKEKIISM